MSMQNLESARILVTRRIPGNWEERLREAGHELVLPDGGEDRPMPREELLTKVGGCHAALSMLTEKWNVEAFDAAGPQFRVVANFAVGFNNVALDEASARGIYVTNTPDVLTNATADAAWGLLMAAARRLGEAERDLRAGRFHGWGPNDYLGVEMEGKTLGIIGAGRIGRVIAQRSMGWNMRVVYTHPHRKLDFEKAAQARHLGLDELLAQSDFISVSVPLSPETHHLLGSRELALMKKTAVLVNTSRGPVIDEKALVEALRERRLFAAGLDVYEEEPKLAEGLMELDNAVLLPHIGSATHAAREGMARMAVNNLLVALKGQAPPNAVNQPTRKSPFA